jgi:arsenate reductase-like glutaredoxin family protein
VSSHVSHMRCAKSCPAIAKSCMTSRTLTLQLQNRSIQHSVHAIHKQVLITKCLVSITTISYTWLNIVTTEETWIKNWSACCNRQFQSVNIEHTIADVHQQYVVHCWNAMRCIQYVNIWRRIVSKLDHWLKLTIKLTHTCNMTLIERHIALHNDIVGVCSVIVQP